MPNPTINPAVLLSPVENGYVAYDPVSDRLHQLNPIAALLTELCDGSRSVEEIRALAGPLMPGGKVDEIDRWVEEGMKAGLLVWQDKTADHREFSAAELYQLAKRLRENGKVQTAYLCGKRAVEMDPQNSDAWYEFGEICLCVSKREEARAAYQRYFDAHPEDAEIEHLLIALRDEAPPPRASDRTIQQIYKSFSASYEARMLEDLKYQGPQRLHDAIKTVIGERSGLTVLDLGCGSGLAGPVLKQWAGRLTGIDLSPEMVALADKKGVYDHLEVAEITQFLRSPGENFDIIASCDVIIYFGDLHEVVTAAANRLKPGGIFVFSMERGPTNPYRITDTGRYEHHPDHVRAVAKDVGLEVAYLNEAFLRNEYGSPVTGLFAVLRK